MEHHAHSTSLIRTGKHVQIPNDQTIYKEIMMQHQIEFAHDRNEKSLRLHRLFKNSSFIDTKQKKLKTKFLMKSSVKWAVDSHHDCEAKKHHVSLKTLRQAGEK